MPKYVVLVNFTDEGIRRQQDRAGSAARTKEREDKAKELGITQDSMYLTMGPYDRVAVYDAPSDEAMAKFALWVGSRGSVRTLTMRAFTEAESAGILG